MKEAFAQKGKETWSKTWHHILFALNERHFFLPNRKQMTFQTFWLGFCLLI